MKLADFQAMGGTVTPTRFDYLHVWRQDTRAWRILRTDSLGDVDAAMPVYRSKAEALAAAPTVAVEWTTDPAPLSLPRPEVFA